MRGGRGFATTAALVMLALFASVALMFMGHLRTQSKRTAREAEDAQLRQLLHAGGVVATDFPKVWNVSGVVRQTLDVEAPADLKGRGATIRLVVAPGADGATATVNVTAAMDARSASEAIVFTKEDSGWKLSGVQVE